MNSVILKSSETSAEIEFFSRDKDYFSFSYRSQLIRFDKRVWAYTDAKFWVENARFMSENWKGWSGEVLIQSIERELVLSFTSDSYGHVTVNICVGEYDGPEPWKVEIELMATTSMMTAFYNDLAEFFS